MKHRMHIDPRRAADTLIRILITTLCYGMAMCIFTIPNDIVPGGVSGLSTALGAVLPFRIGTINLILSLLIEIVGWLEFGLTFIVCSALSAVSLSLFLNVFEGRLPIYTSDPMIAAMMAGILFGIGGAVLLARGISSGGTDTLSMAAHKHIPQLSVGKMLIFFDGVVVLTGALIFRNFEVAVYSAITIYLQGKVVDAVLMGIDTAKLMYIISPMAEQVRKTLLGLDLGLTMLRGEGGYQKQEQDVIMLVVKNAKFNMVVRSVRQIDPRAFVIITDATEVLGEGFKESER